MSRGEPPLRVFPLLMQLWGRLREALTPAWESEHAGFWDTAVRGSSALQAALMRSLFDDVAVARGFSAVSIYDDLEKIYDSVSLGRLRKAAAAEKLPALPFLVSLQTFIGGRALRASGWAALPILPTSSLGAGCRRATALARAMLRDVSRAAHEQ
jgi:hypothetical protein